MGDARWFRDGRIFTGRRYVESLAIEAGRVVAAGTTASVAREVPTGAEVARLEGRLVIPGLIDAHLHLPEITRARTSLDVRGVPSFEELVERLREFALRCPDKVIVGHGWEAEQFREARDPDHSVLDRAVADRPVILYHTSGHAAVVNRAALDAAGWERSSPDPPHGRLGRAVDGTPDGRLYEGALRSIGTVLHATYPPSVPALAETLREMASLGITSAATMNVGPEELRTLRSLADEVPLRPRLRVYLNLACAAQRTDAELRPAGPEGSFAVVGVKGFTDGAFGPRTAWLSAPYSDRSQESGLPVSSEEELAEAVAQAAGRGLTPALHAIGDRAVLRATHLLEPWVGRLSRPARVEHAALTPPDVLRELERVRPALVVQPGFLWSDAWLLQRLGSARTRWAYAFRSLLDRGLLLAGSSDAPYDSLDPWRGVRACVERADPLGRSASPSPLEAIPVEEALALYTGHGGLVLGEPELGSLEPGARADLVVLDSRDLAEAVAAGSDRVRETWVGAIRVSPTSAEGPGNV